MEANRLKSLLTALPDTLPDGVSDSALFSLSYIYISVHNLIAVNDLDPEYGNRKLYRNRIHSLQQTCCQRCGRQRPPERRSRMVRLLFSLTKEPVVVFTDGRTEAACQEAALEITRAYWKEREKYPEKLPASPRKEEFDALRCMADLLFALCEYEEEEKKFLHCLQQKMARWAQQMDPKGEWPGLFADEALERIEIMNRYSCMFLDSAYDTRIRQAYAHYSSFLSSDRLLTAGRSRENMRTLGLLYEVVMQNLLYPRDRILAAKIAGALEEYGRLFPEGSDERLFCARYVIDHLCERIMDERQRPLLSQQTQTDGIKSTQMSL